MSLLDFRDIAKSYGDTPALRGVSFEVREGEVFGLLGPNGAGKTTLIRILMDIIRADAGTITLFGERHSRDHLDRVSYLPEERGLYKKQKVLEVMTYFGALKGLTRAEAKRRSLAWLERIGLAETANWKIERLSKGMSQKVQIASTLLVEPELCVLDEPFSGLDPINVQLVKRLIEERRVARKTTILSTHQMNMVDELCDRVAMINRGELMVYGETQQVRQKYSQAAVSIEAPSVPTVPGVESIVHGGNSTFTVNLAPGARPEAVLAAMVREGAQIRRFTPILAPMEEVFIRVVEEEQG